MDTAFSTTTHNARHYIVLLASGREDGGNLYICSAAIRYAAGFPTTAANSLVKRAGVQPRGLASVLQYTLNGCSITF